LKVQTWRRRRREHRWRP